MAGMMTPIVQTSTVWSASAAPAQTKGPSVTYAITPTVAASRSPVTLQAAGSIGSALLTQQGGAAGAGSIEGDGALGIRTYYEQMADRFDPAEEPVIFGLRDDVATITSFWV
ncbi:hypothetical protein D5400_12840 [Georhizobium profundi]|uniref:Uncharacterized protein n=1 Tax=Georhizobium profundi TaxID=2341112 RepID=A0A3Q8XPA6_9HYPH|nr:hypothetical protein [Georhizobium profundi]AZN72045.1 hypothetical protein D5400_12840 [Georhizobium profundi]